MDINTSPRFASPEEARFAGLRNKLEIAYACMDLKELMGDHSAGGDCFEAAEYELNERGIFAAEAYAALAQ